MPPRNSNDNWEFGGSAPREALPERRPRGRRAVTAVAFTTLFFSGAAITAVAGDNFSRLTAEDAAVESTTTETDASTPAAGPAPATEAPAPAEAATPAPVPAPKAAEPDNADVPDPAAPAARPDSATDAPASIAAAEPAAAPQAGTTDAAPASDAAAAAPSPSRKQSKVVLLPLVKPAPQPELEGPADAATIWLNSALPDPTPPAKRLSPTFAKTLTAASKGAGVDWAVVLGVLRAKGATGSKPADARTVARLAKRLAALSQERGAWAAALAYDGSSAFADRAVALMHYDRALGLAALVHGLESAKSSLGSRLLAEPQVSIYGAGRQDVVNGRVDVRVLALIAYLHEAYGEVTVSSLISGHRLYARQGVVSAHVYGHAVDISGLGGVSILGHQEPGGLTEHAVRDILLLPAEVMPRQVISLLGLGGPSFPLGDHYNHIHVGY